MLLRKGPLRVGDAIILTKGLGTGTLMAADMRAQARGVWVKAAIESMLQSNKQAAAILRGFGCEAATDVTGFGCLGHLLEMVKSSTSTQNAHDEDIAADPDSVFCSLDGTCSAPAVSVANSCSVVLRLDDIPVLPGACECVKLGVLSSLHPEVICNSLSTICSDPDVVAVNVVM